uniref:Biopolymer transporter ExbD n=1 Tax=candidate division WOR-3 bacterium TaxID=2052148 RepID=A0A7V3ZSU9_UNCW3
MKIKRIGKPKVIIPTASMADIAFLLIIFFMLTTVFRKERGQKIILPSAKSTERILKRKHLSYIWLTKDGKIFVMDQRVSQKRISYDFRLRVLEDPNLIVMLMFDKNVKYLYVDSILEALREARALRVTFSTEFKGGG